MPYTLLTAAFIVSGVNDMGVLFTEQMFNDAMQTVMHSEHERYNIGTYSEGTLHAVLKYASEPDKAYHEFSVCGYIADIFKNGVITEIQTRNFRNLNKKLSAFLPLYKVNIVFPVACVKYISVLNGETGEMSKERRSPKRENAYSILPELYFIRDHLKDPNLTIHLCFTELVEYRMTNPKRKTRLMRFDRVPKRLISVVKIGCDDHSLLLPCDLQGEFTSAQLSKKTGLRGVRLSGAIKVLESVGAIRLCGKRGRANLYEII